MNAFDLLSGNNKNKKEVPVEERIEKARKIIDEAEIIVIGRNMAWLLKSIQAGKDAGIEPPEKEIKMATNFIR